MNNLTTRTITGLIYVIVVVLSTLLHPLTFLLLLVFFTIIGIREFYKLTANDKVHPQTISGIIAGVAIVVVAYLNAAEYYRDWIFYLIIATPILIGLIELLNKKGEFDKNVMFNLLGIVYVAAPLSLLEFSGFPESLNHTYSYEIILGYFIILWLYDTGAYLVGSTFGKHKILPRISPGKSWEGVIGGMVIGIGTAIILAMFFELLEMIQWIVISILIAITGTIGDFIESGIKRKAGVKDSGNIFPGHGGMLDRIDSVLFSAPFVFLYLKVIQVI